MLVNCSAGMRSNRGASNDTSRIAGAPTARTVAPVIKKYRVPQRALSVVEPRGVPIAGPDTTRTSAGGAEASQAGWCRSRGTAATLIDRWSLRSSGISACHGNGQ